MKKKAAPPPPAVRWHVRAEGEVQGVGFRWTARREAASLGVSGWAENAWDGTVNLVLEGEPDRLRQLLLQLSVRFPEARFVQCGSVETAKGLIGFEIR